MVGNYGEYHVGVRKRKKQCGEDCAAGRGADAR